MRPKIVLEEFGKGTWDITLEEGENFIVIDIDLSFSEACEKALRLKDNFNNFQGKVEIKHYPSTEEDA